MRSIHLRCDRLEDRATPATFRILSPGGVGSMTTLEAAQTTTLTETLPGAALVDGSAPANFLSIDDPSGATSDNELEIIRDDRFDLFADDVDEIFMFSLGTFTFSPSATFTRRTGSDGTVADVNQPTIGDPMVIEIVAEPGEQLGQPVDVTVGAAGEQFIINTIPGVTSEARRVVTFDPGDGLRQLLDHTFVYDDPATAEASATQTFRSAIGQTFRLGTRLDGVFEVPASITTAFNIDGDGAVGFSLSSVTENGENTRNDRVSAGAGRGGPSEAVLYDANLNTVLRQRVFEPGFFGGIRTATAELSGDGQADLIAAAGPSRSPSVKLIKRYLLLETSVCPA